MILLAVELGQKCFQQRLDGFELLVLIGIVLKPKLEDKQARQSAFLKMIQELVQKLPQLLLLKINADLLNSLNLKSKNV